MKMGDNDLVASSYRLAHDLQVQTKDDLLLVVTGAGVSHASGIPTFRGNDVHAIWKKDVTELGTRRYFEADPVGSWRWYRSRFAKTHGAQPNDAHVALAELEQRQTGRGQFLLVTQNIDGLHRAAGSKRVIEVHGRGDRVRCPTDGCPNAAPSGSIPRDLAAEEAFDANPCEATLPRCPECRAILRQHVLWFDEAYQEHDDYAFDLVAQASRLATAVWFIGTSLSVGITELVVRDALTRGRPVLVIDPHANMDLPLEIDVFAVKAEEALPAAVKVVDTLRACPPT